MVSVILDNIKNINLLLYCSFEPKFNQSLIIKTFMKKKLLIAFIVLSNTILAQVGINTTNPTAMFHVFGTTTPGTGPYAFRLEDGTQAIGKVLTSDANGNGYWQVPASGGSTYTFNNGLTLTGSNVKLGGTLVNATNIDLDVNNLTFTRNFGFSFGGKILFQGKDRIAMAAKLYTNYVNFGGDFDVNATVDGTALSDSGNVNYTIDMVAGFNTGNAGGSAIRTGSVEYIVDGTSELFVSHDFSPLTSKNLGSSTYRWNTVYATNGVINTSDMNLKTNVKQLSYGLNEILKLHTITYNWKDNKVGKTTIPSNLQERKIGFSAQQLKTVLPEVVQTHSWVAADEEDNYKRVENKNLGVYYSDIIPVTVKAIQEQQVQIEDLKAEITLLKEAIELMKKKQ